MPALAKMYRDRQMNTDWYVVITKPRQEIRAQEHLLAQGGQVFLPLIENESIKHGKRVTKLEALFPSYLFVNADNNPSLLNSVRSTRGVNRLLSFGIEPLKVSGALINDMRKRLEKNQEKSVLSEGQKITIKRGPFKDYEAIFSEYDGEKRAIVMLNLLNQQQALLVELDNLEINNVEELA